MSNLTFIDLNSSKKLYQYLGSSSFWIILAAFRLQAWRAIYTVDIALQRLESKIGSKEPKNRQNQVLVQLLSLLFWLRIQIVCWLACRFSTVFQEKDLKSNGSAKLRRTKRAERSSRCPLRQS